MTAGPSLGELVRVRARDKSDTTFIRMKEGSFTFGEFDVETNRVAQGLISLGVEAGDMVTVMLPNCPQFAVAWLALSKLGAVEAPINTAFRGPGLAHMLNVTGAQLMVIDDSFLDALEDVSDRLQHLKTVIVRGDAEAAARRFPDWRVDSFESLYSEDATDPNVAVKDGDLAMLLFTSGTTGRSKACMLSHRYCVVQGGLLVQETRLRDDDVLYCPFPLFHADGAVLTTVPALILGTTAAISERFSVSRYWDEIREFDATIFDFMGATLAMLWKQPEEPNDADNPVRLAWGVPMPDWADTFEERFDLRLVELYGLTDAGVVIFHPYDEPRRPGACGKAVHPYDVRIFDDVDEELPNGSVGEIVVRPLEPRVIMDGYYNMPNETLEAFRNLWFHTGDLGSRDDDGYFYFVGRKKEAIRRRGENISSFEIEEIVDSHPAIFESAAVGVPSELTEEDVKVCVVLKAGQSLAPGDLVEFCRERMAKFMIPRYIEFYDEFPKTPTEKIEKYVLKQHGVGASTWDAEAT